MRKYWDAGARSLASLTQQIERGIPDARLGQLSVRHGDIEIRQMTTPQVTNEVSRAQRKAIIDFLHF